MADVVSGNQQPRLQRIALSADPDKQHKEGNDRAFHANNKYKEDATNTNNR